MKLKESQSDLGINPNPEEYEDINTRNGWYRRKKRKKKAKLNKVLTAYRDATKYSSPAAKRVLEKLEPWLKGMMLQKINAKISGALKKSLVINGRMTYEYMQDLDIHPYQSLDRLFDYYHTEENSGEVVIKARVGSWSIKLYQTIHTHFYMEGVLIWGDPMKKENLKADSVESKLFSRDMERSEDVELILDLPVKKGPWMALLRVACVNKTVKLMTPKYYAMKVVAVGE